jgi:hypothetical protein
MSKRTVSDTPDVCDACGKPGDLTQRCDIPVQTAPNRCAWICEPCLAGLVLDEYTRAHLERWLAKDVHEEEIEATRAAIMRALAENPRLLAWHSWPEIAAKGSE